MELVPSKPQEENLETSLELRRRPDIYTVSELYQAVMDWASPFVDVLTWQLPIVSSGWLILGLLIINLLARFSLPSLLGMLGLGMMGVVLFFAAIMRTEPHEEVARRRILVRVSVPPEVVATVARRVTNWTNRWVATGQHLLFGHDYLPSALVTIGAFNLIVLCSFVDSSTLLMLVYCLAFVLPNLWPLVVRKWGHLWQRPLPPTMVQVLLLAQTLIQQVNEEIIQLLDQLLSGNCEIPDEDAEMSEQD